MKLRDDIAAQYNEGVTFVLDDELLELIVQQNSLNKLLTAVDLLQIINDF